MIWDVLGFCELGAETVIDLRMGVERLTDGRLNAAGSMSGMMMDEADAASLWWD
jgi:hypothetical protein